MSLHNRYGILFTAVLGVMFVIMLKADVFADLTETSVIEFTEAEEAWLSAHPVLKSPTTTQSELLPIYTHDEHGKYVGLGVDIVEIIADKLGIKIEWVDYTTHITAVQALIDRDVDFISFIGENMPGEGTRYILSSFFQQFPSTLVVPKSVTGTVTLDSLYGKRLAAVYYWPEAEYLKENFPDIDIVEVESPQEALQKVAFGEVDACVLILPVAAYEIQAGGITTLRIGGRLNRVFRQGFGIRSDWPELVGLINKALASMTEQEKAELYNKWVPVTVSDGGEYKKWLYRIGVASLVFFIVLCGVAFWNRKLRQANLAERAARAEARRKAEEALEAKLKMEKAVEEELALRKKQVRFIDMISHECRTPVAVLQTNLDIMQLKNSDNPDFAEKNVENMQYAITRLTELLDSGLDKVQSESGNICVSNQLFCLRNCVQEAVEHIRMLWPDRVIEFVSVRDSINMDGDQQLIKTALLNLMENGLKYSPPQEKVDVFLKQEVGNAVITITDRGIGISEDEQRRVFEKYYRSDRGVETGGTGVGLFLVKRTVELHGGSIEIDSDIGKDTVITLILPCRRNS